MLKHRIQTDLSLLVDEGLITAEQRDNIKEFYAIGKKSAKTVMILPLMGVFLVGAGLTSLCAANWQNIGSVAKGIIALIPLLIITAVLLRVHDTASDLMLQCITLGVAFAELFGFGIYANIFQTPIPTETLLRYVVLSLIPLVYVYSGYWLGCLLLAWGIFTVNPDALLLSTIPLLIFVPFYLLRLREGRGINTMTVLHSVALFVLLALYIQDITCILFGLGLLLLVSTLFQDEFYRLMVARIFSCLGVVLSFTGSPSDVVEEPIFVLSTLGCIVFSVWKSWEIYQEDEELYQPLLGLTGAVILALVILGGLGVHITAIASLVMTAVIAGQVYYSFFTRDLKRYNRYSILFAGYVLAKMTSFGMGFMATGILFILIGTGFIWLSVVVAKIMKEEE